MKRDVLLVLVVLILAIVSTIFILPVSGDGKPLACFVNGGSTSGICKS